MGLIEFIVRRKVLVSMLFIGSCLLGVISYRNLPLEIMPDVELPFLIIQVSSQYEVNPEYLERKAIIPLEGAAGSMIGMNKMETRVNQRSGSIMAYFDRGVDLNLAYLDLQERVAAVATSLPEEFRTTVLKVDTERMSNTFMQLQVRGSGGLERLRSLIDQRIEREFSSIEGVANVDVTGGRSESIEIALSPETAEAYNITPGRIRNLIAAGNLDRTFVGRAYDNDQVYFVNLVSNYDKVLKLEQIVVDSRGPVLLGDISDISFGLKEQTTISRVNGKDAVTLQLVRDSNVNLIALSKAVRAKIDELNLSLASQDIQIVIQSDTGEDMKKNLDLILNLALTGGILSVLILWFFMRNMRLVTVVLLAIPISILTAFNFFYGYGISLNSLTLVGMALAVGMLLDNSVVVLENIYRLVSLGKKREIAVTQGTREVWRSILASTLTTVTVFLPFLFADDLMIRLIGRNVGVSIVSTLLVSLVVALLLIPMLAHTLLDPHRQPLSFNRVSQKNRAVQVYTLLLKTGMRYPVPTILSTAFVFFASIAICIGISLDVPRQAEQNELTVYLTMPRGAALETTDLAAAKLESRLDSIPEVEDMVTTVYEDEARVTLKFKKDYEKVGGRDIQALRSEAGKRINNFVTGEVSLNAPSSSNRFGGGMGGGSMASFERMFGIGSQQEKVIIKGNDFDLLRKVADDVEYVLEQTESIERANQNLSGNRPEVHVLLDHRLLSYYSIPLSNVITELTSFQKEVTSGTKFKQGSTEYDIIIRNGEPEDEERNFEDLEELRIATPAGGEFELANLSRIVFASDLSQITRLNQENRVEVTYSFKDEITDSKSLLLASREEVDQLMASMSLPSGVAVEVVHEENQYKDFYFLFAAAFILIYMILASTFESLTTPPVILFTIPLATIGAFWGLILTGNSLSNANSLVGFLILLGVVVNNGIILIDYTNVLRSRGFRQIRALMTAGQARLRPILITAVTTIVGMLPLAMGKAEYVTQVGAPFAITVIGGLSLSTLFTLVFIPTAYSGLESLMAWERSLSLRLKLTQTLIFAGLCALIWWGVDSLLWRGVWLFVAAAAVPGVAWFALSSLRQAREDIVGRDASLTIYIRRLVKIYDSYGRFIREWKKGERMEQLRGPVRVYRSWRDLQSMQWRLPIIGFGIYFIFFYLRSHFWIVVLSVILHIFLLFSLKQVRSWLDYRSSNRGGPSDSTLGRRLFLAAYWLPPALCLVAYHYLHFKLPGIIFVAVLWFAGLTVKAASDRLYSQKINIMRLKGRTAWLRMNFYRLVRMVPVIGRKRTPFRALNGVSLEIENGMFGLLGPNGAGKTTLMRVICGVLDQSYGRVRVNDIDFVDKREELQGLIGYLPQEFGAYENLTAREFLDYIAILKRIYDTAERRQRVEYVLSAVHLTEQSGRRIGSYSGGMKQRIGIAMTLLHLPRILVVDEPTAGLDPRERIRFRNLLVELSRDRIVIFSTHIIEDISSSCNKVAVLDRGTLHYMGDPQRMTSAANGHVWQFNLTPQEFQETRGSLRVVHHMRVEDMIRVRCLSREKPHPEALTVQPTLEDAYLWLLGRNPESGMAGESIQKAGEPSREK